MREYLIYIQIKLKLFLFLLLFYTYIAVSGQTIKNMDMVYDENIQTVLFYQLGNQLTDPVIKLNTDDKLMLEFDDMNDRSYDFRYTVMHCDKDWNTSDIDKIEYIEGITEDYIDDYAFSLNAIPSYVHYKLVFPNENMSVKYSGNYILKVYVDNDDEENVILTRRFFVYEPLVNVSAEIPYYPNNLNFVRKKQQINLKLYTPDTFNDQVDTRTSVFIRQNGRWDNMKRNLKPTTAFSGQLDYNYTDGIVFDGGNQFRNFDMKSFYYQSMYIKRIISDSEGYKVILHTDYSRAGKQYERIEDIHGRKLIKARNDQNTGIEGEYARVSFSLKVPKFENADVFIIGAVNDWLMNEKNRMEYDDAAGEYRKTMFLKQGYYDYMYSVVPNEKAVGDITLIEGDWWDTSNEYKVYVYYSNFMPQYDRLVGYYEFMSHTN
jgi:hypothetical protein